MATITRGGASRISTGRRRIPAIDDPTTDFLDLRDRLVNFNSVYRNRHMARMARNLWYTIGRQWIELDRRILTDGVRGYAFRDLRKFGYIDRPRPVTNFIRPQVENEIARLGRKEFEPTIITDSTDPTIDAAARTGKEILKHRLDKDFWAQQRELFTYIFVVCGTAGLRSGWDLSSRELITVASPTAVHCVECKGVLSSRLVHKSQVPMIEHNRATIRTPKPRPEDTPQQNLDDYAELVHCPACDSAIPLMRHDLSPIEVEDYDMFGSPLGLDVPKGNTSIEVVTPFQLFPINGGLDLAPWNIRIWARAVPRDIDWIEERYPEFAEHLQPQPPEELMRVHPILGEWTFMGRYSTMLDQGIYDNHMMFYEFAIEPFVEPHPSARGMYRLNDGRYITMAGDVLLDNDTLLVSYKRHDGRTAKLPRVKYSAARFGIRLGEFWGQGHVDDLISPQNRINARDSQLIEAMDRMGSPNLMVTEGMELRGPEWRSEYGSGKIMSYSIDSLNPQAKPEVMNGASLPNEIWQERDRMKVDIQDVGGGQEIELGDVPKGLRTTSGLVVAGENASQRRVTREREMGSAFEGPWSHMLECLYALRTEQENYVVDAGGASITAIRQFRGADLLGQYTVKVTREAGVDKGLYQREAAAEAKQEMLYDLTDPVARRKYLELRGLPEINETVNLQIDRARKAGARFMETAEVVTPDPNVHDPGIWYNVLGTFWMKDDLVEIQERLGWPEVITLIAGWEKEYDILAMEDAAARQFYRGMTPTSARQLFDSQIAQIEQTTKLAQAAAMDAAQKNMPMPPPQPNVQPPPQPTFLPSAYEERLKAIWQRMMAVTPETPVFPGVPRALPPAAEPPVGEAAPAPPSAMPPAEPVPGAAPTTPTAPPIETSEGPIEAEPVDDGSIDEEAEAPPITIEDLLEFYAVVQAYRLYARDRQGKSIAGSPVVPPPGQPQAQPQDPNVSPGTQKPELPGRVSDAAAGGTVPTGAPA